MNQMTNRYHSTCGLIFILMTLAIVLSVRETHSQSDDQANYSINGNRQSRASDTLIDLDAITCGGTIDFFDCPPEPTVRDTAIVNMMRSKFDSNDCYKFLDFDEIPWRTNCTFIPVGFFIHKIGYTPGPLTEASIEVSLRAASKNDPNSDYIAFFQGKNMIAGSMIRDLPGANGTWNPNQSAIFTLNLGSLPPSFGFTNLLSYMADGDIDIMVGNETGVDYICLYRTGISRVLNLKVLNQALFVAPNLCRPDTIFVNLRSATHPYYLIDSYKLLPDSTGSSSIGFSNAQNGIPYYIQIIHRNSIETWSFTPVPFTNDILTFDFTTSASQAYGGNMIEVSPGIFAIYSGDVNQDGIIDVSDLANIDNDAYNFSSGYLPTDLNGDGFTDASDYTIADNNSYNFISVIRP